MSIGSVTTSIDTVNKSQSCHDINTIFFDKEIVEINDNNLYKSESEENKSNSENEIKLTSSIESASYKSELFNRSLEFSIHKDTNKIMIKIVDNKTEEVVKEIPPEEILDMMAKFYEIAGILVDEKV